MTHDTYLHTHVHKFERRSTQSDCDYIPRFTSSFSGSSIRVSLLLNSSRTLKLRMCLRHANVMYVSYVCRYTYVASYFLHESTSRISLSLTCCCSRFRHHFSTHPHAYTHTYLYNVRRLDYRLRFRVNYTFTVHALVSADFPCTSRAVRT